MVALVIGICLAATGIIVSVYSYYYDLEEKTENAFQIVSLGMVGVGTILGFWSVLRKAGENGWGLFIIAWFVVALLCIRFIARRSRRTVIPVAKKDIQNGKSKERNKNNCRKR
jgi:hypothetical protein